MATEVLYYPFMKPPETWLRSALLFNDRVYTIVPADLQGLGWLTKESREIVERLSEDAPPVRNGVQSCVLSQVDPGPAIVADTADSTLTAEVIRYFETNKEAGNFVDTGVNRFLSLAGKKLPPDLREWLVSQGLYVEVALDPDGGRIQPNIGNYFMNRLASIVSSDLDVPSATQGIHDFACNALHGIEKPENIEGDVQLLGWSLSVIVPDAITELDTETYLEVRKRYQEIAVDVSAIMHDLAIHHRIDRKESLDTLVESLEGAQQRIDARIQTFIEKHKAFNAKRSRRMGLGGLIELLKSIPVVGGGVGFLERVTTEARRRPGIPATASQAVYANLAERSLQVQELALGIRRHLAQA